jgi:hypothetical protein
VDGEATPCRKLLHLVAVVAAASDGGSGSRGRRREQGAAEGRQRE